MKKINILLMLLLIPLAAAITEPAINTAYRPEPIIEVVFDDPTNITVLTHMLETGILNVVNETNQTNITPSIRIPTIEERINETAFRFVPAKKLVIGQQYTFTITAQDALGNKGTFTEFFKVKAQPFGITIKEPSFGVSSSKSFRVVIETTETSDCVWSTFEGIAFNKSTEFDTTGRLEHIIPSLTLETANTPANPKDFFVQCLNKKKGNIARENFPLSYDTTEPIIKVTAPDTFDNLVVDPERTFTMQITADEDVQCEYKENNEDWRSVQKEFSTNITRRFAGLEDSTTYNYRVRCKNKADLDSDEKTLNIRVDTSVELAIRFDSPAKYIKTQTVKFIVRTSRPASCGLANTTAIDVLPLAPSLDKKTHEGIIAQLSEGKYEVTVECSYERKSDGVVTFPTKKQDYEFAIDLSPPEIINLTTPEITSSLRELTAKVEAVDNQSGIKGYWYAIGNSSLTSTNIVNWTFTEKENIRARASLVDGTTYTWTVKAENNVGLNSTSKTSTTKVDSSYIAPTNITNETISRVGCIVDEDADGYGLGCVNGLDCDDTVASLNKFCTTGCEQDGDGDGYGPECYNGNDCDDTDPTKAKNCENGCIIDTDGDGFGPGCTGGPDCDDEDRAIAPGSCTQGCTYDRDCDGMDNKWETRYGLNPDFDDSAEDPDEDGIINIDEYRAGTNPTGVAPIQVCGNSFVEGTEECDDGNTENGDGCSAICTIEPEKEGIGLMTVFLIIAIIIVLGLIGFYGYQLYQKQQEKAKPSFKPTAPTEKPAVKPRAEVKTRITEADRRAMLARKAKQAKEKKEKLEREKAFEAFAPKKKPVVSKEEKKPVKKIAEKPPEFKSLSHLIKKPDEFAKLGKITEKQANKVFEKIKELEKKDFNKLDKLFGETSLKSHEVAKSLSDVTKKRVPREEFVENLRKMVEQPKKKKVKK